MGSPPPRRPGPQRGGLARLEGKIDSYIFALLVKEVLLKPRRFSAAEPGPRPARQRAAPPRALRRADVRSCRHGRLILSPALALLRARCSLALAGHVRRSPGRLVTSKESPARPAAHFLDFSPAPQSALPSQRDRRVALVAS